MSAGATGSGNNDGNQQRKGKPRNKYKLYESDMNARPPRQTVRSRQLRAQNLEERERRLGDEPNRQVARDHQELNVGDLISAAGLNQSASFVGDLAAVVQLDGAGDQVLEEQRCEADECFIPDLPQEDTQEQEISIGLCVCGRCENHRENPRKEPNQPNEELHVAPDGEDQGEGQRDRGKRNAFEWLHESIYPGVSTTKFESFLMVLHLCMHHGMTGPLVLDILKMINALFGVTVIPESKFIFKQLFSPTCNLQYHFYCPECDLYLGERISFVDNLAVCNLCGKEYSTKLLDDYGDNYFVILSIRHQLEEVLKKPDIEIVSHLDRPTDAIRDFMDGEMYRKLCAANQPLANPYSLTGIFNTDGAPVWHSSKGSIWPLQLVVNEVSPKDRFRPENVLLLGIWFGKGAPKMSVFLQPFISELQDLATNGVKRVLADGMEVYCPFFALACSVDAVAKPKLQAIKQFNGHFGCGYCYHPNTAMPEVGGQGRYVADQVYPLRSHTEMVQDIYTADALRKLGHLKRVKGTVDREELWDDIHGLKGVSCLLNIPYFDTVFGYMEDYMHLILAGVSKKFGELFFDTPQEVPYCIAKHTELVDARLKGIAPPHTMTRAPRAVSEKSFWKCIEWKSFLLLLSLPCLQDLLPQKYFDNLRDLVISIHILLKDCITPTDLAEAEERLKNFVVDYNTLYGNVHMVYNIHQCSHLVHMVRMWGPLWATCVFPFESGNGALLKLIKGTRGVATKISQKYATVQSVRRYVQDFTVSDRIIDFCNAVCSYTPLQNSKSFGETTCLGWQQYSRISEEEMQAFHSAGVTVPPNELLYYNRVIRDGVVYYSKAYKRPTKFNDTCVELQCGRPAVVQKILSVANDEQLWSLVNPIRISQGTHLAHHIKTCAADLYAPLELIQFEKIVRKCIFVSVENHNYVCYSPNMYERN